MRTIHSSYVDLDPTEYRYVGSLDQGDDTPGRYLPAPAVQANGGRDVLWPVYDDSVDTPIEHPGLNPVHAQDSYLRNLLRTSPTSRYAQDGSRCDHCGAWLRYVVVMRHLPTGTYCQIGETCHAERFSHDSKVAKDLDRLHKRAAAERALAKVRAEVDAWLAADPDNLRAVEYAEANREACGFYADLLRKLRQYGPWSDRQRDAVLRGIEQDAERAKRADDPPEPQVPVPEGQVEVTGSVVKVDVRDDGYRSRVVWTVKDDRGFLVWGTVPTIRVQIPDPYRPDGDETSTVANVYTPQRGDRVRFTAREVTRSDRDEAFGFYKRPTRGEVLEASEAA